VTLVTPLYMQPASGDPEISYSALQDRAGLLDSVFAQEGVLDVDAGQLLVTPRAAGANYSVDVAAGKVAIRGDDVSDQGTYVCSNTTPKNLATPAKPASGTRRHRLIARVRDKLHNGTHSTYDWTLQILADTGSGTPAQPASAVTLAFITMTSTMSSVQAVNIEDARARASVGTRARIGAITPFVGWTAQSHSCAWSVTPDGWVLLAGFIRRTHTGFNPAAGVAYEFAGPLPAEIRPIDSNRHMVGITSAGPVMYVLRPTGVIDFVFVGTGAQMPQNVGWCSLDGCSYRLE
jgi:hypothetical protein